MREEIKVGDIVNVHWENTSTLKNVEVLHIPAAAGDSWRFRDQHGKVYYVNTFSLMELISYES